MRRVIYAAVATAAVMLTGCNRGASPTEESLLSELSGVADRAPGTIGIAFVEEGDTVTVNNGVRYAMMSVFKLHECLAVASELNRRGCELDTLLLIEPSELDHDTWSPMLKEYGDTAFTISARQLIDFALIPSDNNASNILFNHIVTPAETDSFLRTVAEDTTFAIRYSEADMKRDHSLSYRNHSSPLAAALLIRQLFTTTLTDSTSQEAIKGALTEVTTGQNRLGAAIAGEDVVFGHKTGSGYRNNNGELIAFNDVAYVRLPDGRDYSLAVMIRDFYGSEDEAAEVMAEISGIVYRYVTGRQTGVRHLTMRPAATR